MKTKKKYEKPATQVFELKQQPIILAGSVSTQSGTAEFEDYGDPIDLGLWN